MNLNKDLVKLEDLMIWPFHILLTKEYREALIKKALQKTGDFETFAKLVRCNSNTIRYFKSKDNRYLNAPLLKKILNFLNIQICEAEKHVISVKRGCSNRAVNITLPVKSRSELALLLAKVLGDGSICSDWRFHYTNNQLNLIKEVINAVNVSIGKSDYYLHNRVDRKIYEIKFPSVIGYILNLIGGPKGYKVNQEFKIPDWIMNGNKNIKSSFLRGLFDDESSIDHSNKHTRRILLAMGKNQIYEKSHRSFLEQIQKLLLDFNIQGSSITTQERYADKVILRISIYRKSNFENFKKVIGFTHVKKNKILGEMIDDYVDKHKTKKVVLKTIKTSKKPLTIKEVAKLNKIKRDATKFHLYDLLKMGMVTKIEGKPTRWC